MTYGCQQYTITRLCRYDRRAIDRKCDGCGEYFTRLVDEMCGKCRDKFAKYYAP